MAMDQPDKFPIYEGSVETSKFFYKLTLLSVPLMLFFKPFILKSQHEAQLKEGGGAFLELDEEHGASAGGHGHGHGEEFEFGEVFIHQIIETIEYVLGTVSHTASYLRIWALSLAHQQLSLVFFQKTLSMGLAATGPTNGIILYIMFAAWFGVTLAVLLGMDVLECFLHTLRLHWVEFQSKFYKADGYAFEPYKLKTLVMLSGE
jgi:V-type H+-transporting ATPase subunit a